MRLFVLFFLLNQAIDCLGQNDKLVFGLYFGNDFSNDSVTIYINGRLVANRIQLRERMFSPENLMIEQDTRNIYIRPYNSPVQTLKKIAIARTNLKLEIKMNGIKRTFDMDLNKGKFLYARYKLQRLGRYGFKVLEITQESFSPIII
jgi:hypothetical protein